MLYQWWLSSTSRNASVLYLPVHATAGVSLASCHQLSRIITRPQQIAYRCRSLTHYARRSSLMAAELIQSFVSMQRLRPARWSSLPSHHQVSSSLVISLRQLCFWLRTVLRCGVYTHVRFRKHVLKHGNMLTPLLTGRARLWRRFLLWSLSRLSFWVSYMQTGSTKHFKLL